MIPKVKRYRISYWKGTALLYVFHVNAPTKLLARLALRDELWHSPAGSGLREAACSADRITYYVERKREVVGRSTWGDSLPAFAKRDGLTPQTVQPTPESVAKWENYAEVKRLERQERDQ